MVSVVDSPKQALGAGLSPEVLTLRGWHNLLPISISVPPSSIASLRERMAQDIASLTERGEKLERVISDKAFQHPGYLASKRRQAFALDLKAEIVNGSQKIPELVEPPPRIRHSAVPVSDVDVAELLQRTQRLLFVGEVSDVRLRSLASERTTDSVTPGGGELLHGQDTGQRLSENSFSAWLAMHDEDERALCGAIVLGRTTGRPDVDLLRYRLYGHHRVIVEAGSAALTWLLAQWDGSVARHGDLFVFSEPGELFREPSTRRQLSPGIDWPRISVVTVSYNQGDYLEACLLSVLNQGYPNLEYIVIDACSTDGSIDILRRYETRLARLVIEPDEGQSDGLNKGFSLATGDILTWINSDDMLAPLALKRAAMAFASSDADIVAGTCSRVAGVEAHLLHRHYSVLSATQPSAFELSGPLNWCENWEKGDYFYQPEVFFTADTWRRSGGYLRPDLYWAMDWELWLRFALAGAVAIRTPDVLGVSRVHDEQKTTSDELYIWQVINILRDYDDLLARLQQDHATP